MKKIIAIFVLIFVSVFAFSSEFYAIYDPVNITEFNQLIERFIAQGFVEYDNAQENGRHPADVLFKVFHVDNNYLIVIHQINGIKYVRQFINPNGSFMPRVGSCFFLENKGI